MASYELEPIMHDFVPVPFSIKNLVASGLFKGETSVSQLSNLNSFSEKELCVLGGLCGEARLCQSRPHLRPPPQPQPPKLIHLLRLCLLRRCSLRLIG